MTDTKFVIRSMSTTDAGRNVKPVPYHIYLKKPELRATAYWCRTPSEYATFASVEEAQAEIDRLWPRGKRSPYESMPDVVPEFDRMCPTYWEARRDPIEGKRARVIGVTTVWEDYRDASEWVRDNPNDGSGRPR